MNRKFNKQLLDSYIVVDLETTGLSPETDEIIEIAAVKVINGNITEQFSTLVKPTKAIPYYITEITGIDNHMVQNASAVSQVMPEFLKFLGNTPLLGHNIIRFDLQFLKKQAAINNFCVDTLNISQHIKRNQNGNSLSALCEYFGIINDNAHRALSDCIATHKVYKALINEYKKNGAFFTMSIACTRKEHQKNIAEKCAVGTELTYTLDTDKGRAFLFADGAPVGTVSGSKFNELAENSALIKSIKVNRIQIGAKERFLMSAEVILQYSAE